MTNSENKKYNRKDWLCVFRKRNSGLSLRTPSQHQVFKICMIYH